MVKKMKKCFLGNSHFSRKNFARTVWEWSEWGGRPSGMPERQPTKTQKSNYYNFHNFTVLFQPHSVEK
jgi:hypothetical protein